MSGQYPRIEQLESVTVILPVMNETTSLAQTVETILREAKEQVLELLVVVCKRTTPEAMAVVARLQKELGSLVVVHHQGLPFLGGAVREAFQLARGSHLIIMASDLETDPKDVRRLIAEEAKNPSGIVTASRWQSGGQFEGYSRIKLVANWVFQKFFSWLYGTHLTDMTYGYRILPTRLAQCLNWEELRHPLLFETIVKPLRLGVPVTEIASSWRCRVEGESQNTFFRNFEYFRVGLKTRFARRGSLLRPPSEASAESRTRASDRLGSTL
jgi:glycosyltransferase involved in cell wall biosynthesis